MNYVLAFIISFIIWKMLTWNFEPADTMAGALVAVLIAALFGREFPYHPGKAFKIRRYVNFVRFFLVFLKQMFKANFVMAYRVLSPGPPIKPGVVKIPLRLTSPMGRIVLANSITLAPGTFTMDIGKDFLLVHWIYKLTDNPVEAEKLICGNLQNILKEVFE